MRFYVQLTEFLKLRPLSSCVFHKEACQSAVCDLAFTNVESCTQGYQKELLAYYGQPQSPWLEKQATNNIVAGMDRIVGNFI